MQVNKKVKQYIIKLIAILFIIGISFFSFSYSFEKEYYLGDISQDGRIDITDQVYILRHIYAEKTNKKSEWLLKDERLIYADVNEDNNINLIDVISICRYIAANKSNMIAQKHKDWLNLCRKIETIEPTSLTLDKTDVNLTMKENPTTQLVASILPENANSKIGLKWESKNTEIATVSNTGVVTAVSSGSTVITVTTQNGKTTQCNVKVNPEPSVIIEPTSLTLDKTDVNLTMKENPTTQLVASILPENANSKIGLTWKSENTKIATVSNTGVVTAVSSGSTVITVTTQNGKIAQCNVKVNPEPSVIIEPTSVTLDKTDISLTMKENPTTQLVASILPKNANSNIGLTWESQNTEIATVSNTGVVTAVSSGSTVITVTTQNGKTAQCNVKVNPEAIEKIEPQSVTLNKTLSNLIVKGNSSEQLTATIQPPNANTNTQLLWESSDDTIATVSQSGLISAKKEGKVVVKVSTGNNKIATCTINIILEEGKPIIKISKSYEGNILTAGTTVEYPILIEGNNIKEIDTSKVKLSGTLASKSKLEVTGNNKQYKVKVTVPNEIGTLGVYVDVGMVSNISDNKNDKVTNGNEYVFTLDGTTAINCITATVGVHNSFYIKDYDFYLGNTKKVGDRTTNEYTYTTLTEGNTYKVRVYVTVYKNKTSNDTVSGWLEKEIKVEKNDGVEVHFIDVVEDTKAADCIFIKTKSGKTIMIDTGADDSISGYKNKVADIDKYLRKSKNSKDSTALVKASNGIIKVDYLIVTHTHGDHLGGFAGLTGVHYKAASPGYSINKNNKINGDTVRYEFGKIILGCNVKAYKGDEIIQKEGVNVKDGAEGKNTTQTAKTKAIYCYANTTNRLKTVTAGNTLKIDNIILNIFNPYNKSDIPSSWIDSDYDTSGNQTTGIRSRAQVINGDGEKMLATMTTNNNNSVVVKLICGSRKMLLTGDAEFYTEEILLGIPAKQIANKTSDLKDGLAIHSSNGGANSDSVKLTSHISLVHDLINNQYGGCTSIEQIEEKYKVSRLTTKDIGAQVLKKAHHGARNSTSLSFLNAIRPNKIVSTGRAKYTNSIIKCVDEGPDYRIRKYYNSTNAGTPNGAVKLTSNNWYLYIFGISNNTELKSKGSFYIFTQNSTAWDYSNPYSK